MARGKEICVKRSNSHTNATKRGDKHLNTLTQFQFNYSLK